MTEGYTIGSDSSRAERYGCNGGELTRGAGDGFGCLNPFLEEEEDPGCLAAVYFPIISSTFYFGPSLGFAKDISLGSGRIF